MGECPRRKVLGFGVHQRLGFRRWDLGFRLVRTKIQAIGHTHATLHALQSSHVETNVYHGPWLTAKRLHPGRRTI